MKKLILSILPITLLVNSVNPIINKMNNEKVIAKSNGLDSNEVEEILIDYIKDSIIDFKIYMPKIRSLHKDKLDYKLIEENINQLENNDLSTQRKIIRAVNNVNNTVVSIIKLLMDIENKESTVKRDSLDRYQQSLYHSFNIMKTFYDENIHQISEILQNNHVLKKIWGV